MLDRRGTLRRGNETARLSPGLSISLHWWRGLGGDTEPDLFCWRLRLGFLTVSIDKVDVLKAYQKLRETMVESLHRLERRQ